MLVKAAAASGGNLDGKREAEVVKEEEEVEEELPWIQEKALDLVEFTGSVTQALPGPRVGQSSLPWILAVPMAYLGVTFVIAVVKTVKKFNSPREKRRKLVGSEVPSRFVLVSILMVFCLIFRYPPSRFYENISIA